MLGAERVVNVERFHDGVNFKLSLAPSSGRRHVVYAFGRTIATRRGNGQVLSGGVIRWQLRAIRYSQINGFRTQNN